MNRLLMSTAVAMIALLGSVPTGAQEVPYWVGPAHSGSWYSPERSGEGFTMQILDNGSVLALWFTYPPAGAAGEQAWIIASGGRIEGDRIRFAQAVTTRGPRFGPAFDPALVQMIPWGTLDFRFTACNEAEIDYAGPPAWGSGSRRLARLTALSELECTGKRQVTVRGARAIEGLGSRSGMWFDPAHNGEGWTIEELPDGRAVVYWFTYNDRGEQAWTIGTGSTAGGRITIDQNLLPVGTRFGSAFNPAQVELRAWGQFEFEFESCGEATLRYGSSLPAFGSGTLKPVRLTRPAGTVCLEQKPLVPAAGTWITGAPMPSPQSEIATATVESRSCLAGGYAVRRDFQCYDALTNAWTVLAPLPSGRDHGEAIAFEGDIYVTGGNVEDSAAPNGWRYRFAEARWEAIPELPLVVASGAAVLDGFAYFASESGYLVQFDPRTRQSRIFPGDNRAPRDHSQLVAFQGELWLIGGRGFAGANGAVSIFDPASETWRPGPGLPSGRAGFAAAASPSVLFVGGGERLGVSAAVLDSAYAIAAGDNEWTALPRMPVGVHGVGSAVHGNAFYMLGGSRVAATASNFGDVQIYRFGP
jgi:hypothetical protein